MFSKVDLVKEYHKIPVRLQDVQKTAVATPFGLFKFVMGPFGLKNAAQTFQRLMDVVVKDLPGVFVYLDDVLIASQTRQEHLRLPWKQSISTRPRTLAGESECDQKFWTAQDSESTSKVSGNDKFLPTIPPENSINSKAANGRLSMVSKKGGLDRAFD